MLFEFSFEKVSFFYYKTNKGVTVSNIRIPPHNLEAERSVLGAVLSHNDSMNKLVEAGLEERDFFLESHQKIYDTLLALSQRGQPLDLVTLSSTLKDRGHFDAIGGTQTLTTLFEDHFAVSNVSFYANIVRNKALLRRMIDATSSITSEAFDGVDDVDVFLDDAERKVFAVSDVKLSKSFSSMKDVINRNIFMIEEAATKNSLVTGLPSGFNEFDKITSGLHGGQLIIVAGRPAMGKTSLVLSMAQNAAFLERKEGKAVIALFSLEMTSEELGMRILSGASKIDAKRLKVGRVMEREYEKLAKAADILTKTKIHIDDSGDLTVMNMRARCRRLLSQEKRLDMVVVDYLQLMQGSKGSQKSGSREQEISEISRGLKALAKELKVPIIALSQLNRGLESRVDKRPMLSDLRESGAIEQDADMVCFVYRDEVYNRDTEDKGVAELIISKHRAGETGTVRLAWIGEYTLFANLAEQEQLPQPGAGGGGRVSFPDDISL